MVDRIGDWYAFSRTAFCRRLTLYDGLPWNHTTTDSNVSGGGGWGEDGRRRHHPQQLPSSFSLATAELVAMAPFGGLIAVLGRTADFAAAADPSSSSSLLGGRRPYFNLSAHSASSSSLSSAARALHVFTNAGELLATVELTSEDLRGGRDAVRALGWTPEGELFCLLEPSLTVLFVDMRDVAVAAVQGQATTASSASRSSSPSPAAAASALKAPSSVSRRVHLRPSAMADVDGATAVPPISAHCITAGGLLCVEGGGSGGQLRGLLHEEKFTSTLVPPVRLPLYGPRRERADAAAEQTRQRVTAVEMVPPAWNDSGDFVVLWSQHGEPAPGVTRKGRRGSVPAVADQTKEADIVSTLCAMVVPDCSDGMGCFAEWEDGGGGCDGTRDAAAAPHSTWPAVRLACPGRVLSLSVCLKDPTQLAVFTALGVLRVYRSNLSSALYAIDLGLCRVLRDMALSATAATGGSVYADLNSVGAVPSQSFAFGASFAFGEAPWRARDADVMSNASSAGNAVTAATAAAAAVGSGGGDASYSPAAFSLGESFSPSSAPLRGGLSDAHATSQGGASAADACPRPYKVEWCGSNFVLLHFYQSDFQYPSSSGGGPYDGAGGRAEAPMFSLLVCTQRGCSVHCERLDWSLDGSGHIATVAEEDGVRVVSDTTCYLLQEVPACLAKLCRVQRPFSAAAQVVQAYQAYTSGDRRGIAQVRAALSSTLAVDGTHGLASSAAAASANNDRNTNGNDVDGGDEVVNVDERDDNADGGFEDEEMSHAEGVVYELLDCASHEMDVGQQCLLVAAASFAGETIHLRSGVPDVIVDVVRRLRVLRAVREEPGCHTPLTITQYQVLIGSEERPARLLSSSEGSVLVDRLAYLGYYQLALDVVRALHMKALRVLGRWACSYLRRHADTLSDAQLHREVTQVLSQHAGASYVEAATAAHELGRRDLALRLLRDEPQQQRQRVMLCVKMGELQMAGRAAASSGSAELIHLVVCALVAKEAQARRQRRVPKQQGSEDHESTGGDGGGVEGCAEPQGRGVDVTAADVFHCLVASPELLCWLLVGAQCLAAWQSMAQRLLFSGHWSMASLACQQMLCQCLRLSTPMHHAQLQRYMADTAAAAAAAAQTAVDGVEAAASDAEEYAKAGKKQKGKKRDEKEKDKGKHRRGRGGEAASDDDDGEDDGEGSHSGGEQGVGGGASPTPSAARQLPPPLCIHGPSRLGASAALREWTDKTQSVLLRGLQHAEELRHTSTAARYPFSVIVDRADQLRAAAAAQRAAAQRGEDFSESFPVRRSAATASGGGGAAAAGSSESGEGANAAAASTLLLAHEHCVRTILSTPTSLPRKDAAALTKEQELARLRVSLAVKHNAPRLSRAVSVVDLLEGLCGLEGGEEDAAAVQHSFHLGEKMFFFAKLRGMCVAARWQAVDRLLGPAPPLRKRSFFSVSDAAAAATPPCVGYLPVVQMLTEYGQEERAARYVAGACAEAVDRVVLYMSLGAPVMALEAAMVEKDAGLVEQIMQRVPGSAKVQTVGQQMLAELRGG